MNSMTEKQKQLSKPLEAPELDFRVQSINNGGYATVLAYKDARVDMNRLNGVFGVGGWQRKHDVINGNLFCSVGIWNPDIGQWCWVQDVGVESMSAKEKGQASDSFKRACFNLGIGVELYDYPAISIKLNSDEWEKGEGNKPNRATWKFNLKLWKWCVQHDDSGKVSFIAAKDQGEKVRFTFGELKR